MTSSNRIKEIVDHIAQLEKPDSIVLFGSYANGTANEESDVDILIIKDTDLPLTKRCRNIRKSLRGIAVPLDLIMYTSQEIEEWKSTSEAFITKALKQGKIMYEKQN